MQDNKKSIGILGGMGPDASAQLYRIMIELARTKYQAQENQDYPDIVLHSVPVPDFISKKQNVPIALAMLQSSVRQLGPTCRVLAIACNTAHLMLSDLQSQTDTPFVSMIESTAKKVVNDGHKKIGLLATPTTFRSQLYQNALQLYDVQVITPDDAQIYELGEIVLSILAGDFNQSPQRLVAIADVLVKQGAEVVILGCTELPLVFPKKFSIPVVSSLDVLADTLLERFYRPL